jgi:hypothetical protein
MPARSPIAGACVWRGAEMASSTRWIRDWPPEALAEIDRAVRAWRCRGLSWETTTAADFPLPGLTGLLRDAADELESGCGMVKLCGLPVARYSEDELRALWMGIGVNLGRPVFQNCRGELMRAIRDEGAEIGARYGQIDQGGDRPFLSSYARTLSNGALRFHTDRCDVVGLLCVRQAKAGGISRLCSSPAVHNAMLDRRPDLADALYGDIWRSRFGEEIGGDKAPYPLPIFGVRDGRFTSHYSLTYIEAAQILPGVPRLTPQQRKAIDMLMALADELSFDIRFEPGDVQLLNNHVIYHGRTPFEDDRSSGHDRLLLRLWLSMPNSRALPNGQEALWGNIEAGALRGGIGQTPLA